jgi:hypothetical protein
VFIILYILDYPQYNLSCIIVLIIFVARIKFLDFLIVPYMHHCADKNYVANLKIIVKERCGFLIVFLGAEVHPLSRVSQYPKKGDVANKQQMCTI